MSNGGRPEPVRATLVAILQQLNRVESMHEGHEGEQTLELPEIERLLHRFWAVEGGQVKVPLALGLLVRNSLVEAVGAATAASSKARGPARVSYRITADGKRFLIEALAKADRIS
jgi:hypothetical protein